MQEKKIPLRNKDKSKQKFLDAVGSILKTKGYEGLKVNDIAQTAGLDKKLIYRYFGNTNGLLDEYILSQDFWSNVTTESENDKKEFDGKDFTLESLINQFDYVFQNKEFQKIILWRLSEERDSLRNLTDKQEENGELLFNAFTDSHFGENSGTFRAIMAILISGIYYMNLYAQINGSIFCGIDLQKEDGREKIKDALTFLVDQTYKKL